MKTKKSVLITGGCGFIGLNLIEFLLKKTDWNINVIDNLSVGKKEDLQKINSFSEERINFYKGDIRNAEDVDSAIQGCDYVVNLAAQTDIINSINNPILDAEVNITGILNLLNMSVKHNIERFIQASSAAPLGEQIPPVNEKKGPQPLSPYGASKLACEGYCSAYAGSYGLQTVVLRFSNVYGPKSFQKGSVIAKFIRQVLENKQPIIYGDGKQTRDFIYVEDITRAIYLSLIEDLVDNYNLFQIGTGVEISVNKLYDLIQEKIKKHGFSALEPKYTDPRQGEIYRNYCDISKAADVLGYNPSIDLEEGIEKTVEWFLSQKTTSVI